MTWNLALPSRKSAEIWNTRAIRMKFSSPGLPVLPLMKRRREPSDTPIWVASSACMTFRIFFYFHSPPPFPQYNWHFSRFCGDTMTAEEKTAKEMERKRKRYEEQQPAECSPGAGGHGQVQDAGCPGRWWSSYLLNYNRIIQNNSNQRLVSKSIVVHSIKNFISSSFSCYIHKQEI